MTTITNESQLVFEIMRELGKHGPVFRTNAGHIRLPNGKVFRGLPKGFSDVMFIGPEGRACFVEAKVEPNKPTAEQLKFIERMRSTGCYAGIAYSVAEAKKICNI